MGQFPTQLLLGTKYQCGHVVPPQVQLLRDFYQMNINHIRDQGWSRRDWMYGDLLRSDRPRLQSMSKKLVELGMR